MPLKKCKGAADRACISSNIKMLIKEGRPRAQAIAIATSAAQKNGMKLKTKKR